MLNKIKYVLLILVLACALTACGNGEITPLVENPHEMLDDQVLFLSFYLSNMALDQEELNALDSLNDDERESYANMIYQNAYVKTEGNVMIKGLHSYADSYKEIGANDIETFFTAPDWMYRMSEFTAEPRVTYDVYEDRVIANVKIDGELHDGVIEVIYDKNLHVTSVTTNVLYSLGESMEKAGMNTLIGMGTVFFMLIVISIIISAMKVIPTLQESFAKKKEEPEKTEKQMEKVISDIVERENAEEEAADDSELVAVIAAAIAAYESEATGAVVSTDGFVVRSIRRIR